MDREGRGSEHMKYVGTEEMAGWTDAEIREGQPDMGGLQLDSGLRLGHFCPEMEGRGHSFAKNKKWTLALLSSCFLGPQHRNLTLISSMRLVILALPLASVPHQEEERVGREVRGGSFPL